jgi:hypothetical protein
LWVLSRNGAGAVERCPVDRQKGAALTAVAAYAGTYYSPELEAVYRVDRAGDGLALHHVRHGEVPLEPIDARTFTAHRWPFNRIVFERDATGAATAFLLSGSRVRNLRFVRLPQDALPTPRLGSPSG